MTTTIQIPVPEFQPHKYHLEILQLFDSREENGKRFFQLNWHRRSRKTTLAVNLLIRECVRNPKSVYLYIAPTYKQAKQIIVIDPNMLKRYLPPELGKLNETELRVDFINGSVLQIKGADDPDSIRGIDCRGVVIDEWAFVKPEIWEEILRPIITQNKDRWAVFTFTPHGQNHAFDYWDKTTDWPEWYRGILRASESGILAREELEKSKIEMPIALYDQEFECSFTTQEEYSLITSQSLENCRNVLKAFVEDPKKVIACDPSMGGDECVIYVLEENEIIDSRYIYERDTMKIVGELSVLSAKHKIDSIAVDVIGIGRGVADRLKELGKTIIEVQSAENADEPDRFYNRRTEMWWLASEKINSGKVPYIADIELRRQLSSVKYRVVNSSGLIQLEPKDIAKKILGRSPDRADCFVYGLWAKDRAEHVVDIIKYQREHKRKMFLQREGGYA